MNRAELIEAVTERIGDKRTAGAAVEAVLDVITRAVAAGEKVTLTGFGIFERVERAARTARNPATGESIDLAETSVPKFRAGSAFKQVVADPRTLPAVAYDAAAAVQSQSRAGVSGVLKAGAAALAAGAAVAGAATKATRPSTPKGTAAGAAVKAPGAVAKKAPAPATAQTGAPGKGEAAASAGPAKKAPAAKKAAEKAPAKKAAAAKAPAKKAATKAPAKTQGDKTAG